MPSIQLSRETNKSAEALWKVLADFPNIADWNSGVKTSFSTSTEPLGLGATRHCDLSPAGQLEERIGAIEEGKRMLVIIEQTKKAPMKTASADFSIEETPTGAIIGVNYEFVPKGGAVGRAAAPAMKKAFTRAFTGFLEEWDEAS